MIDTARNFLEKSSILRTLDAMMYNKLSVLHWHITDDESFPIELPSIPEMQEYGSFGRAYRYSVEDVREIVQYAAENGVRVIPEVTITTKTYKINHYYPANARSCRRKLSPRFRLFVRVNSHNKTIFFVLRLILQDTCAHGEEATNTRTSLSLAMAESFTIIKSILQLISLMKRTNLSSRIYKISSLISKIKMHSLSPPPPSAKYLILQLFAHTIFKRNDYLGNWTFNTVRYCH